MTLTLKHSHEISQTLGLCWKCYSWELRIKILRVCSFSCFILVRWVHYEIIFLISYVSVHVTCFVPLEIACYIYSQNYTDHLEWWNECFELEYNFCTISSFWQLKLKHTERQYISDGNKGTVNYLLQRGSICSSLYKYCIFKAMFIHYKDVLKTLHVNCMTMFSKDASHKMFLFCYTVITCVGRAPLVLHFVIRKTGFFESL